MGAFSGRVVIVTGGSGNLGGAVVEAFHAAGATLVVPDRKAGVIAELYPQLNDGQHLLPADYDAMSAEANEQLAAEALSRFGRIDIVVNTIGGYRAGTPLHETAPDTWDFMLNLNGKTAFLLSRAVLPAMLEQNSGVIVHTAAQVALHGNRNESAYAASKATVARIVESMADEYKANSISVNAILPHAMDTPQNRAAFPKADFSKWVKPEAVAQVILFLASDAGRVISGALIPI